MRAGPRCARRGECGAGSSSSSSARRVRAWTLIRGCSPGCSATASTARATRSCFLRTRSRRCVRRGHSRYSGGATGLERRWACLRTCGTTASSKSGRRSPIGRRTLETSGRARGTARAPATRTRAPPLGLLSANQLISSTASC